jgi:hypothetical protein
MKFYIFIFIICLSSIHASEIKAVTIAKSLNLSAGSKAIVQWERVFNSTRKMKRYRISQLNDDEKNALKEYLINHAIDSDQPTIAGV